MLYYKAWTKKTKCPSMGLLGSTPFTSFPKFSCCRYAGWQLPFVATFLMICVDTVCFQTLQYLAYGIIIGASHILLGTPVSLDTMFSIESNRFGMEALVVAIFIIPATGWVLWRMGLDMCCTYCNLDFIDTFQGTFSDLCGRTGQEVRRFHFHVLSYTCNLVLRLQPGTGDEYYWHFNIEFPQVCLCVGDPEWVRVLAHNFHLCMLYELWW